LSALKGLSNTFLPLRLDQLAASREHRVPVLRPQMMLQDVAMAKLPRSFIKVELRKLTTFSTTFIEDGHYALDYCR
jgi:hypothetical protein